MNYLNSFFALPVDPSEQCRWFCRKGKVLKDSGSLLHKVYKCKLNECKTICEENKQVTKYARNSIIF